MESLQTGISRVVDAWVKRNSLTASENAPSVFSRLPVVLSPDWDGIMSVILLQLYTKRYYRRDIEIVGLYYTSHRDVVNNVPGPSLQSLLMLRADMPLLTAQFCREYALWLDCDTYMSGTLSIGHHMLAQTVEDVQTIRNRGGSAMFNPNIHLLPHTTFFHKCPFNTAFMLWHALDHGQQENKMLEAFVCLGDSMASFPKRYRANWHRWCTAAGIEDVERCCSPELFDRNILRTLFTFVKHTLFMRKEGSNHLFGNVFFKKNSILSFSQWQQETGASSAEQSTVDCYVGNGLFGDIDPRFVSNVLLQVAVKNGTTDDMLSISRPLEWRIGAIVSQTMHPISSSQVSVVGVFERMEKEREQRIVSHAITSKRNLSVSFNRKGHAVL